jgi:hypothetical protein
LARPGKHPASPAPNNSRAVNIEAKFQAMPVAAVKRDQHITTRVNTSRGP